MARRNSNSIGVVANNVPEDLDSVQGISFPNTKIAGKYAAEMAKASKRIACKLLGLETPEQKATLTEGLAFDVFVQPVDEKGEPVGTPAFLATYGQGDDE